MMTYNPGDVVDVPFPFIDAPGKKLRPAIVLSGLQFQQTSGAIVLMMVTSAERNRWETDIELDDWRSAGLRKASILRWKIFTLDEQLIVSRRGILTENDQQKVRDSIKIIFAHWSIHRD
jgi:mRNA interferase MazF